MVTAADLRLGCAPLRVPAGSAVLWLAWTARGLSDAVWTAQDQSERPPEIASSVPLSAIPEAYALPLQAYFAGEPVDPVQLPVDLIGTEFQLRVWNALRQIQRGAVRSYAGIAADVGQPRGMRAVGMANARNPVAVVVPCHRVIDKDMTIGGYSAGLPLKRYLLALEGVRVVGERVQPGQLTLL